MDKVEYGSGMTGGAVNQCSSVRECAHSIVKNNVRRHKELLDGWKWLDNAMERDAPNKAEEESLAKLLSAVSRERY